MRTGCDCWPGARAPSSCSMRWTPSLAASRCFTFCCRLCGTGRCTPRVGSRAWARPLCRSSSQVGATFRVLRRSWPTLPLRDRFARHKGADLASRINGPLLTLGAPTEADRAILAASFLRRYFGGVALVERGVLDFFAESGLSPRQMEYLIGQMGTPADGRVSGEDLRHALEARRASVSSAARGPDQLGDRLRQCLARSGADKSVVLED